MAADWSADACWLFQHTAGNVGFQVAYRWLHYLSATVFVGLLAFLNLLLPECARGSGAGLSLPLLRRVFWLWRWSVMLVLFTGLNLLHMLYDFPTGNYFDDDKGLWMAVGASVGFFMWCLAWFWIWPAQKRHFSDWERAGGADEPLAVRAAWGVRLGTALTPPLLMGMAVGGHGLTLFSWGWRDVAWTFAVGSLPVLGLYARLGLGRGYSRSGPGRK